MRTLLLAALLALPRAAAAGPALGLRLGYALASGEASSGTEMSEVAKADVPLQLDATWRFGPHFSAGLYFAYGFTRLDASVADRCDALGADCSVSRMRTGIQAAWAFTDVSQRFAPWLGLGIGYEWMKEDASLQGRSGVQHLSGWELLDFQGGVDVVTYRKLALGPYVDWSPLGWFTRLDGSSIVKKSMHQWLGFGVRGTLDL
jgi:outer membrane protein W